MKCLAAVLVLASCFVGDVSAAVGFKQVTRTRTVTRGAAFNHQQSTFVRQRSFSTGYGVQAFAAPVYAPPVLLQQAPVYLQQAPVVLQQAPVYLQQAPVILQAPAAPVYVQPAQTPTILQAPAVLQQAAPACAPCLPAGQLQLAVPRQRGMYYR